MRASAVVERSGIPSVSIIGTTFVKQARAIAQGLGIDNLPVAEYPGVVMTDSKEELQRKVKEVLINNLIKGLTAPVNVTEKPSEPEPRDIIFKGTLAEVNEFFIRNLWTDGLPVIPPTIERVAEFLKFTDRSPEETIGVLLPENRAATVWNTAVNGLMAGCRPEYMPILLAVVEAIAESEFRIEDAGSTPGWEPLIILNGPIIKELGFNYETGVLRVGRQANTSIGRFLRLYMRNVAGLRIAPEETDKGTIAATFNVVLAENEDAVTALGWPPFSVDRGFQSGENVVTVQSVMYASPPTYSGGDTPLDHLETISEVIGRRTVAYWTGVAAANAKYFPLLVMSPSVAKVIAQGGWTKDDVRRYLYENVKTPAGVAEKFAHQAGLSTFNFCDSVASGAVSPAFCESTDPDRLVPAFLRPDWIGIVVSGDSGRNQSRGYVQNQRQGWPVSKRIALPASWGQLLQGAKTGRG